MKNRLNLLQLRLLALFGAFALTVTSFIAYMHDETAGLYCAAVTLCYLLLLLVLFLISRKSAFQDGEGENLSTLTIDFLSKLSSPVLLISDEDTVAWYNRAFSELDSGVRYGAACHAVLEGALTLDRIKAKAELNDASPLELRVGDKSYSVSYFKTDVSKKEFYLTLWTDITELTEAKLLLRQRNVLVAYIVVDNMSEITQGIQDSYRESSAKIGAILSEWAASLNGILKEYERDKYILLFEERYMNEIVAGKFEILDRINAAGSIDAVENLKLARDDFIHIPFLKQQDIFVALIFLEDAVERSRPFAEDSADLRAGFAVAVLYALRNLGHIIDHDIRNEYISLTEKQLRLGQFGDIRPEGEIKFFF